MRATLDRLVSLAGIVMTVLLAAAAVGLFIAASFIGGKVDQQLSDQKIVMPKIEAINADEGLSAADKAALTPFAGSPMNTGPEAEAYADHFILAHMNKSSGGKTYAEYGAVVRAACGPEPEKAASDACAEANKVRASLFQGSTLRGLLLYGYAFATMGTIAGVGAWVAALGAIVMLALSLLGFRHAKRAAAEESKSGAVAS